MRKLRLAPTSRNLPDPVPLAPRTVGVAERLADLADLLRRAEDERDAQTRDAALRCAARRLEILCGSLAIRSAA